MTAPPGRRLFLVLVALLAQVLFFNADASWSERQAGTLLREIPHPLFLVKEITVEGTRKTTPAEIRQAAQVPLGANMLAFSVRKVAARIAELNWVRTAHVFRRFPSSLSIVVQEREPTLAVAGAARPAVWYAADDEGVVLEPGDGEVPRALHLVVPGPVALGRRIPPDQVTLGRQCWNALGDDLQVLVESLHLNEDGEVTLACRQAGDAFEVRLGTLEDASGKLSRLRLALARAQEQGGRLEYIDVRYPRASGMKFRGRQPQPGAPH